MKKNQSLNFEVGWLIAWQIRALVGDRISLLVQVVGAMSVSFIVALIVLWKLALVMISVQPLILFCYYMKKKLLTRIAVASIQAQQNAAQVASEAVAQHRTVTAFSAQDKVGFGLRIKIMVESLEVCIRMSRVKHLCKGFTSLNSNANKEW